jgi:hypothetical protein
MRLSFSRQRTKAQLPGIDETYPLGWPQLAAFLNSADSFAIFRRFGTAHCRVLLHLQVEITAIEEALDRLDTEDASEPGMLYRLRRHEWKEGWDTSQRDLLDKLSSKLSEYGKKSSCITENIGFPADGESSIKTTFCSKTAGYAL